MAEEANPKRRFGNKWLAKGETREDRFTTIRIRKKDKELLSDLSLPREALWETVKRIIESFAVNKIKK